MTAAALEPIDRVDLKGNITSHLRRADRPDRSLCGLRLWNTQGYSQNGACLRCDKIARRSTDDPPWDRA